MHFEISSLTSFSQLLEDLRVTFDQLGGSWGPQSGGPEAFWRQLGPKGDPRGLILTPFSDISPSINVGGTGRQAAGNIGV